LTTPPPLGYGQAMPKTPAVTAACALLTLAVLLLERQAAAPAPPAGRVAAPLPMAVPAAASSPAALSAPAPALRAANTASLAPGLTTIEIIVRRNDTLDAIFRKLALSLADLADIRALHNARAMLDRLMPGESLRLTHRDGALIGLERNLSLTERLEVTRAADGFRAAVVARPIDARLTLAHGVIDSSLFDAAQAASLQDQTVLQLAQIFAWDIDFALDLRPGDELTVSYERLYQNGQYLQDGAIVAASFTNQGRAVRAVRYRGADGGSRYYGPEGRSMQKAFLRVRQGETVAYVGMTGLATGPHLHYEFRLNGRYLDPQRVRLPDAAPLDAALMSDFRRQTAPLLAGLSLPAARAVATVAAR
jgi:murein DD-endopeptidase MepM/ murein hydrolase activator NlpD